MKFSVLMLLSILLLLLPGCSSKPTVYVYAKYLNENERNELTKNLTKEGLDVKSNKFDFPSTITSNTVLYSLLLQEPDAIDKTSEVANIMGFPVSSVQMLTQGNHWYTKNSLALFLLPEGGRPDGTLLSQDLAHQYQTDSCSESTVLTLNPNGTFELILGDNNTSAKQNNSNSSSRAFMKTSGQWKLRQFPYLELQEYGASYANFYFEISQSKETDQISEIHFINLTTINVNSTTPLPLTCVFTYGERI